MTRQDAASRYAAEAHVSHIRSAAPAAGTVVMVHGLGGDTSQFDSILRYCHCPAHDIVRADLRAHGATQLVGDEQDFTFGQLALDLATFLDQRADARPLVGVGVSMGAGILAAMALAQPARFSRLVLVRPAWEDQPSPVHLRPFQEVAGLLGSCGGSEAAQVFRSSQTYQRICAQSTYAADTLLREFAAPHATARKIRLERMPASTPFSSLGDLRKITIPVTVIGTPADPLHPVAVARHWAEHLPHAVYRQIPPKTTHDERYAQRLGKLLTSALGAPSPRCQARAAGMTEG